MRFVSKAPKGKTPTFWVEDYTKEEKEFFESIGFVEKRPNVSEEVAKAFKMKSTLSFTGTGIFTLWTKEEYKKIVTAIATRFKVDSITVYEFIPD